MVFQPWHIIEDGQNDTRPSYTMVSQPHSHHDSLTTTSAPSLTFSSDSLASVNSYPPLELHASTAVPVSAPPGTVVCTAPTVPFLVASRTLTMAEALKSGQGSSLSPAAPSVLDPSTSDTTLPSSSSTYFAPKYSLRSTCGADLRCLNIFKATMALRHTIGDFPRFDHCTDKSITITVSSASQGVLLRKMTSLLGDPISVDLHPSWQHSQGMITSPILHHMTTADILEGLSLQRVCKVSRISPSSDTHKLSFDVPTPPGSLTLCPGHTVWVRPAYPLPTRCYKCQHYGHSHLACKSKQAVCGRCSLPLSDNHSPRTCSREPLCFHCKIPHAAFSSSCPKYIAGKRILVLHHRDRIPLADARRAVMSQMTQTSQSQLAPPSVGPVTSTAIADNLPPCPTPVPLVSKLSPAQLTEVPPAVLAVPSTELAAPSTAVEGSSPKVPSTTVLTDEIFPASFRPQTSDLAAILRTVQVMEQQKPPGACTPSGPSAPGLPCAMDCSSEGHTRKRSRSPPTSSSPSLRSNQEHTRKSSRKSGTSKTRTTPPSVSSSPKKGRSKR